MRSRSRSTFITALGAGVAAAATPRFAGAQASKLRLICPFADPFAEPLYAQACGSFAKSGFDIEVTTLGNGATAVPALAGGAADLGTGDLIAGVNAILAGVPLLLVAGGALYVSSLDTTPIILAVAKDSAIREPRDITGKTIAVPTLVGMTTAALRAWLPQHGVELASVKLIELPQPAAAAAIGRHTIDVTILGEPFITPIRDQIRDIGHPMDAVGARFLSSGWFAWRTWVDADRVQARRAIGAIYETARWANAHHAATMQILVREAKLDPERLYNMVRSQYATSLTPPLLQPLLDVGTRYKIFDRPLDASTIITRL